MKRTFLLILTSVALVLLLASCGSNSSMTQAGMGNVTIQTGDATNDQIVKFELTISSITLTGAAGTSNTQNLLNHPREVEFSHEAGSFEPLTLAHVPPGTYSGATLMVSNPEVVAVVNGVPTKLAASLSSSTINVTFTSNIMVGNSPMFLNFDLDMTNSLTISGNTATVAPTFKVTAVTVAPNEDNEDDDNGEIEDVHGKVTDVTAPNFTIQTSQSTITFATDSNTRFTDGLNSLSDLKAGEIVEVDGITKSDGTKLATKVELEEGENGMEVEGIVSAVTGTPATQITIAHQVDSSGNSTPPVTVDVQITSNTQFLVRLDKLGMTLNVPMVFDASHIGKGQRVEVDSSSTGSPLLADKVKLREQALIGVISNLNGNTFTLTVNSTSAFASLSGATTVSVIVLSGGEDEVPLTNGATVRIRGLVFFDGTKYTLVAAHTDNND
jgi:Domain of unknown function (DUF5666)/Domain of unknown function (DUF4382)